MFINVRITVGHCNTVTVFEVYVNGSYISNSKCWTLESTFLIHHFGVIKAVNYNRKDKCICICYNFYSKKILMFFVCCHTEFM
jgi:hypothetical protein